MPSDLIRLAPVLYVGPADSTVLTRLRESGLRVIVAERADRGVRLLRHFVVAGVVYDLPSLGPVLDFVALKTPVVMLAAGNAQWGTPDVQVVPRQAQGETIVAALGSFGQIAAFA